MLPPKIKANYQRSLTKKEERLGMSFGMATGKLRKAVLFKLVQDLNRDRCHQCDHKIESIDQFSIDHIKPWLNSDHPKELFFDIENIAFSHMKCNIGAARHPSRKYLTPEEKLQGDRKRKRESARQRRKKSAS